MPDTFDLDRAFEALAHDVMDRTSPPSAGRAIKQARRRRRTAIATVALAAAVVVGGVAVPTLLDDSSGTGFADGLPVAAPLDADAMERATKGWIEGWSDNVASSFTQPNCLMQGYDDSPEPVEIGVSHFGGYQGSGAAPVFRTFADTRSADLAWRELNASYVGCPDSVSRTDAPSYPAGTEVRHYTVVPPTPSEDNPASTLTDAWLARTGTTVAVLEVTTEVGNAEQATIESVAHALVAGLLDGWVEETRGPAPDVKQRPQLPSFDERDLIAALDGWRGADRAGGVSLPHVPCIPEGDGTSAESSGSPGHGRTYEIKGYLEPGPEAAGWMQEAVAQLRDCGVTTMTETSLADGVTLFTFELAVDAGHGAIWLAANEDRNMVVTVNGAATPLPAEIGERVGQELTRALAVPWGPAE